MLVRYNHVIINVTSRCRRVRDAVYAAVHVHIRTDVVYAHRREYKLRVTVYVVYTNARAL